jgi:hypothetical protein
MTEHATEAMLLKWNASPNGATITLLLPDETVLEQFKSMKVGRVNGQRLGVAFAVISDDETKTVMADGLTREDRLKDASNGVNNGLASATKPKHQMTLPQRVAMTCQDEEFGLFLLVKYSPAYFLCEGSTASVVKDICGVQSRKEIQLGTPAADKWRDLYYEFEAWRDAR